MKKFTFPFLLLLFSSTLLFSQKQLVVVGTGYGFDAGAPNGVNPGVWTYFQKWASLTYNGQDASPTAFRLHIQWAAYEPTAGAYQGAKLAQAVGAILALKPGLKIALHFPFQRHGPMQEQQAGGFLAQNEIARIADGTKVEKDFEYTIPSFYSASAKTKFFNFVNDALSHLTAYYSNILYVEMGNGDAEEFIMPVFEKNGYHYPAMYDDAAVAAWRTEYLPCRYPGQSTVTWSGNTFNIASAPSFDPGTWGDFNSEHGREYHRFASWGLMKMYTQFRDTVKAHNSNIKVLMFEPGFGTTAGNIQSMHNSILPMSLTQFDGIYSTEGGQGSNWRKIMALDVLKGTNPGKIAGIEFDPDDLGQQQNPKVIGVNPNVASEWIPRAYKHGADYVHLAMSFDDSEIDQLAPAIAAIKPVYLNGSYTSPSRQAAPGTTNIYPNSFTGNFLFDAAWNAQSADNWTATDLNPKSVNMIDDGYWQNVTSCMSTPPPCDFNIAASGPSGSVAPNTSVQLNVTCSGQCTGVTYSWSGNGISGSGATKTFTSPGSSGTYTYTVTASKSGCTNKTATYQLTVGVPCDFSITGAANPSTVAPNGGSSLSYACTGANCGSVTYTWSGNGISGSGTPKSIVAPGTAGVYNYVITASKSGCANKTATIPVTVSTGSTGSGCIVNKVKLFFRNAGDCCMDRLPGAKIQGSSNGTTWTDLYTFTTNGTGAFQEFSFSNSTPYTSARFVASSTGWGELRELEFYNGTTKLSGSTFGTDNYVNAFDGNTATEWHAPTTPGPNNYAGMNFTGCTSDPCDFNITAAASPSTTTVSGQSTLTFACTGTSCSGVTYAWSGNGISGTASPKSITAPGTVGNFTYTVTASKSGCTSKTATTTVTTTSTTFNQCLESESSSGNGTISGDPNASNGQTRGDEGNYNHYVDYSVTGVPAAGTYYVKLRYYSSTAPVVGVSVNSGTAQTVNLANSFSWNITWTEQTIAVTLPAGSSTIRIQGTGGGSCRQDRVCISSNSGSPLMLDPLSPDEVINANQGKGLLVAPNPGRGIFQARFYLERGTKATMVVTDMQGRTVHMQQVIGHGYHNEKVDLTNKASGMLIMRLQKTNGVQVQKVNIVR